MEASFDELEVEDENGVASVERRADAGGSVGGSVCLRLKARDDDLVAKRGTACGADFRVEDWIEL
jgi:hypothetical protein